MRAIILAAGQGARLRPLTHDRPKCMVEYQGRPLLAHVTRALRANGVEDVVVVRGYCPEAIHCPGARYRDNPRFAGTNMVHTLFCAEEELVDDVIISYSDIVYGPDVVARLLAAEGEFNVVIDREWRELWQQRMSDPLADAETLRLGPGRRILELGKKARSYSEIEGQYIGLFRVRGDALARFVRLRRELDSSALYDGKDYDNMYMTSFIQAAIDRGMPVTAVPIHGGWLEIDAPSDLQITVDLSGQKEQRA